MIELNCNNMYKSVMWKYPSTTGKQWDSRVSIYVLNFVFSSCKGVNSNTASEKIEKEIQLADKIL